MKKLSLLILVALAIMALGSIAIAYPNPYAAQNQSPGVAILMNATQNQSEQPAITDTSPGAMFSTIDLTTAMSASPPASKEFGLAMTPNVYTTDGIGTPLDKIKTQSDAATCNSAMTAAPPTDIGMSGAMAMWTEDDPPTMETRYVYIGKVDEAGSSLNWSIGLQIIDEKKATQVVNRSTA